jgi:hypothetical protein
MKFFLVASDHIYNWSENERQICGLFEKAAHSSYQKNFPIIECNGARIINRKIQTLWQTKLQVCSRKRPWAQILPFDQSLWGKPDNEVHFSKRYKGFSNIRPKFSNYQKITGGGLRNQYGIIFTQSTIKNHHASNLRSPYADGCHSKHAARFLTAESGGKI